MPTPNQITVLVVDDIPENITLLLNTLRDAEFRVFVAESGESAMKRLKYVTPDVILLDVAMPDLNGFQTCQRIKRDPATAEIPILFLTARDEVVNKVHGFQVGGVDYITKPIQVEEVLARIDTHVTLSRLQREIKNQNETLETRVQERTAELEAEIQQRKKYEAEKQRLLDILSFQSDQISSMTQWLVDSQQERHEQTFQTVHSDVADELAQLITQIQSHQTGLENQLDNSNQKLSEFKEALTALTDRLQNAQPTPLPLSDEEKEMLEGPLLKLTAREREILLLIVDGKSHAEIAEFLTLSAATVRSHRSRIMQKLELKDAAELMRFALRHNLTNL